MGENESSANYIAENIVRKESGETLDEYRESSLKNKSAQIAYSEFKSVGENAPQWVKDVDARTASAERDLVRSYQRQETAETTEAVQNGSETENTAPVQSENTTLVVSKAAENFAAQFDSAQKQEAARRLYVPALDRNVGFKTAFDSYYNAGLKGIGSFEAIDKYYTYAHSLPLYWRKNVFSAGRENKVYNPGVNAFYQSELTSTQKNQIRIMDAIGKEFGISFIVFDRLKDDGAELNGMQLSGTNKILVSLDADGKLYLRTAGHECFHLIEEWNPAEAQKLIEKVIGYLKNSEGYDYSARVTEYANRYGVDANTADGLKLIHSEMVADSMFDVFSNEKFVKDLVEKNRTLAQKLKDILQNFLKQLRNMINSFKDSAEMNALREQTEALEEIRSSFHNALRVASTEMQKNLQNEQKNSASRTNNTEKAGNGTQDEGNRYSFAGVKAKTHDFSLLEQAIRLDDIGKATSEEIRQQTSWFRGYDGQWRFEIDDSKCTLIENPDLEKHEDAFITYFTGKLSDILQHNDLYKAYPQLRDINIIIQPTESGIRGVFQPNSNYITLSLELFKRHTKEYEELVNNSTEEIKRIEQTPEYHEFNKWYENENLTSIDPEKWLEEEKQAREKFYSSELGKRYYYLKWGRKNIQTHEFGWSKSAKEVLMHEIQHAVQKIENFASGSTPEYWKRKIDNGITIKTSEQKGALREVEKEFSEIRKRDPYFYSSMIELIKSTPSMPRGEVNWDTLEQIEEDPIEWQRFDKVKAMLEKEYGESEVNHFLNLDYKLKYLKNESLTADEAYIHTAGEIEARDTANRLNFGEKERKNTRPDIDRTNVVFADGSGIGYSIVEPFTDNEGNYYNNAVLLDTQFFNGTSPRNWGRELKKYLVGRSKNNPFILPVVDENGNVQQLQFAKIKDRVTKNGKSNHKVLDELSRTSDNISKLSVIHIDEIIEVSEGNNPYFTTEHKHQWLDEKGWLHRSAYVINATNGNVHQVVMDIAKAKDGRIILFAVKGKTKKVGNVQVNSLKIKGSGQNSNFAPSLTQNSNGVNSNSMQQAEENSRNPKSIKMSSSAREVLESNPELKLIFQNLQKQMKHSEGYVPDGKRIHQFAVQLRNMMNSFKDSAEMNALREQTEALEEIRSSFHNALRVASTEMQKNLQNEQKNSASRTDITEKAGNGAPTENKMSKKEKTVLSVDDVKAAQSIGRKSVNDLSSAELNNLSAFAKKYWKELGVKSPFFRAWFGDWRENHISPVRVVKITNSKYDKTTRFIKNKDMSTGDIEAQIKIDNDLFGDSFSYAKKNGDEKAITKLLSHIDIDTVIIL